MFTILMKNNNHSDLLSESEEVLLFRALITYPPTSGVGRGGVITIYYLFPGYYKGKLKILGKSLFSRGVSKLFCQFFTPSFSEG